MFKHFEDDVEMYGVLVYNGAGDVVDTMGNVTLWRAEDGAQEYIEHCRNEYSVALHDKDGTFLMAMWVEPYMHHGHIRERIMKIGNTDGMEG